MKKNKYCFGETPAIFRSQQWVVSTILLFWLMVATWPMYGQSYGPVLTLHNRNQQGNQLNVIIRNQPLQVILEELEKKAGVVFVYTNDEVNTSQKASLIVRNQTLERVLEELLAPLGIGYEQISNKVVLTARKNGSGRIKRDKSGNYAPAGTTIQTSLPEAQALTVTGRITSETGQAMVGVSVSEKGTTNGTATDAQGGYKLTVADEKSVIVFSFIGYTPEEVVVGNRTVVDITLVPDIKSLSEVVVVGYGTVRKSDLTGSVSSISAEQIKKTVNTSLDQALAGRAAGVQVTQTSGQPGGAVSIRIRGGNSINGGNEPLYVIDGFPVYNNNNETSAGANRGPNLNALASLNPNDIESIEVLKDASATAIYGTRGANGVVIITTKRGKAGQNNIDFESYYGVQQPQGLIPMMNAREYAQMVNEGRANDGLAPYYTDEQVAAFGEGTNWQKELFRNAPIQNYQLTFSGGDAKTRYAISTSYFDQQGIIINSDFKRLSTRINLDRNLSDRFRIGNSLTLSRTKANQVVTDTDGGGNTGVVLGALLMQPTLPVYNADGTYLLRSDLGEFGNPIAYANELTNESTTYRGLGNVFAEYDLIKDLTARVSFGADVLFNKENLYIPSNIFAGVATNGRGSVASALNTVWLNENTLSYKHSFNERHSINAVAGFTVQNSRSESVRANSQNFPNNILGADDLASGATPTFPATGARTWGLVSYLGRVNYNLADKYLITFTGRADGSSRFGSGNKYAFFPSGAVAWRLINESFMQSQKLFHDLKIRASVGITGNQEIGQFQSLATLDPVTYIIGNQVVIGYTPGRFANPNLRWEKTAQADAGVDAGFLKGRFNLTVDAYYKQTNDLLLAVTVPYTSGFATSLQNIGRSENKGLEIGVNSVNLEGPLKWTTDFNIAFNRNKILDLGQINEFFAGGNSGHLKVVNPTLIRVGQPTGQFYGYVSDGIFRDQEEVNTSAQKTAKPGDRRYKDLNEDGRITADDRTYIGSAQPKFIGGITNTFTFKGFELSVFFQYSYGNKIFNYNKIELELPAGIQNVKKDLVNRWSPDNPDGKYPRATTNRTIEFSDQYIEDGSFLRARNVSLSYQLPQALVQKCVCGQQGCT